MDNEENFFIDRDGNKISVDNISSHIGLANKILEQNEAINDQFIKSGIKDPIEFLINYKGYIKVSRIGCYKECHYASSKITQIQKEYIDWYKDHGFNLEDDDLSESKDKER